MILEDISFSNDPNEDPATAATEYQQVMSTAAAMANNSPRKIATALGSLLLASVFIGLVTIGIGATRASGFSGALLIPETLDALILLACCILCFALLLEEGTILNSTDQEYVGQSYVFGKAIILLCAAFISRLLSNPALFVAFLTLVALGSLLPLLFCLGCLYSVCCDDDDNTPRSTSTAVTKYSAPQEYTVAVVDREMVYAEQKTDGSLIMLKFKETFAFVTTM
jgi:hypothetical protein